MTQRGNENLSAQSKQLISFLGCLGSSDVIIIPSAALVSVRLISTTATDRIIKAPGCLCSSGCTDEAHEVCFGGKTKHGICVFELLSFLSPSSQRSERSCQDVPHAAWEETRPRGLCMWPPPAHGQPAASQPGRSGAQRRPLAAAQGPRGGWGGGVFPLVRSPASGPRPWELRNPVVRARPEGAHLWGGHSH